MGRRVPTPALVALERALGEYVQLVPVHNVDQALGRLRAEPDIALIVCGVHFDESRMFDLLRAARSDFSAIPFVCCRIFHAELPHVTPQAIEFGADGAVAQFRDRVLAHLPAGRKGSAERRQNLRDC